jgi:hypothetical protein
MGVITQAYAKQLLLNLGMSPRNALIGSAIMMAESSGKTDARNGNNPNGGIDRGPWQINSRWHPEVTDTVADTPELAAVEVDRISKHGLDWTQWSTFTNGAYKRFMGANPDGAGIVVPDKDLEGNMDPVTRATVGAGKAVAGAIDKVVPDNPLAIFSIKNFIRVGYILGGFTLMIVGIGVLAKDTVVAGAIDSATGGMGSKAIKSMKGK